MNDSKIKSAALTDLERELVMRELIMTCRVTNQSIVDCLRRGPEMADQLKVARAKESGLLKVMGMIRVEHQAQRRGASCWREWFDRNEYLVSNLIPIVQGEVISKTVRHNADGYYARIPMDCPILKGWTLVWYNYLATEIHTVPLGDKHLHVADKRCNCNPSQDPHSVFHYTHHAYDTREKYERQGLETGTDGWTNIGAVGEYRHYPEAK